MENKLTYEELESLFKYVSKAHNQKNTSGQRFRQDKFPYLVHPLWCATTLLMEKKLSWEKRYLGFKVLMFHDLLEDTCASLPESIDPKIKKLVKKMSYQEWNKYIEAVENYPPFLKLLILFDKIQSMYENGVSKEKRREWQQLVQQLIDTVEKEYGNLRIIQLAKAINQNTNWK